RNSPRAPRTWRQTMRRPPTRPARWAALCGAALLALAPSALNAAPAPFARAANHTELRRGNLAGTWTLYWHGSRGVGTLTPDGGHSCRWWGLSFTGTWRLREGQVCITETYRPNDKNSWHTFRAALGQTASQPAPIRLERVR